MRMQAKTEALAEASNAARVTTARHQSAGELAQAGLRSGPLRCRDAGGADQRSAAGKCAGETLQARRLHGSRGD